MRTQSPTWGKIMSIGGRSHGLFTLFSASINGEWPVTSGVSVDTLMQLPDPKSFAFFFFFVLFLFSYGPTPANFVFLHLQELFMASFTGQLSGPIRTKRPSLTETAFHFMVPCLFPQPTPGGNWTKLYFTWHTHESENRLFRRTQRSSSLLVHQIR